MGVSADVSAVVGVDVSGITTGGVEVGAGGVSVVGGVEVETGGVEVEVLSGVDDADVSGSVLVEVDVDVSEEPPCAGETGVTGRFES